MQLVRIYNILKTHFGFLNWWPGDTKFEVCIGAILTQSTSWRNVETAINNLKSQNLLTAAALYEADINFLAGLIRPALYYNQKAKKIKIFVDYFLTKYNGSFEKMLDVSVHRVRRELLALWGIGQETADSILLYALEKPVFVIDAYTRRILQRHGYQNALVAKYDELQTFLEATLPKDIVLYNDFHAQFVALGKNYCRKTPLCANCPLLGAVLEI